MELENIKKSLDNVEDALLTKAVADDTAKKELRENIAKQLNTLILKTEVALLEKHLTTGMFTKPVTEPAKAIAKPAISVGKKVGSAVGKIGAKIGAGAGKIGSRIADYGKGVGTAAKAGAATWKDPTPKTINVPVKPATRKEQAAYDAYDAAKAKMLSPKPKTSVPKTGASTWKDIPVKLSTSKTGATPIKPASQKIATPKTVEPEAQKTPDITTGTGTDTEKQMASAQKKRSSGGI